MKILVLNGSPRGDRSNTLRLTDAFLEGFCKEQPAQTERIDVNKKNIKPCIGCFSCWNKTPGKCCLEDDMAAILEKIIAADLVIWSFPLYCYGLPSQIKALMDRELPMALPLMVRENSPSGAHPPRYDFSKKRYVIISTCGFYTAEGNYDGVDFQFDRMIGKGHDARIYCGQGELFHVPQLQERTDAYLEFVKTAGAEFAVGAISAQTKANLSQLLFEREVFEDRANASWNIAKDSL